MAGPDRRLERPVRHSGRRACSARRSASVHRPADRWRSPCSPAAFAWLSRSVWGIAMRAVRDSRPPRSSDSIRPPSARRRSALGGAGRLGRRPLCLVSSFISPESFPFFQSILSCSVVMLGGADRVLGPFVGALVVVLLPELLSTLGRISCAVRRSLILAVLLVAPDGLGRVDRERSPRKERDTLAKERENRPLLAAGASGQPLAVRQSFM